MFRILLVLLLISTPVYAVTQWQYTNAPATGDNLTDWPTEVNAQWAILNTLLSNYRKGYAITYSSATTIAVSAGEVVVTDSGGTTKLFLQNTSSSNVTFANIDTGAEASATTYYLYCGTSSATASTCTFYLSTSSSAPSGVTYYRKLGSIYNNSSSDIDPNKVYTEPAGFPFTTSSGILASTVGIYDYGTSASSSTRRNLSTYYIAHGLVTLSSGAATISNLPFTSSTSYAIILTRTNSTAVSQDVYVSSQSASSFTIGDTLAGSAQIGWVAIGY